MHTYVYKHAFSTQINTSHFLLILLLSTWHFSSPLAWPVFDDANRYVRVTVCYENRHHRTRITSQVICQSFSSLKLFGFDSMLFEKNWVFLGQCHRYAHAHTTIRLNSLFNYYCYWSERMRKYGLLYWFCFIHLLRMGSRDSIENKNALWSF